MIATDEDALMCDLAEVYHIYDFRQLPALKVAVFSVGLREDSRIKMLMTKQAQPFQTILLAGIMDRLSIMIWQQTKDGQNNRNRPLSILDLLTTEETEREEAVFNSGEEFERARQALLENIGGEA